MNKDEVKQQEEGVADVSTAAAQQLNSLNDAWRPDPELLKALLSFGFTKNQSEEALFCTGNNSADLAVSWILDNSNASGTCVEQQDSSLLAFGDNSSSSGDEFNDEEQNKMVFVVNAELKMGLGKIAAQTAHAALGLYRALLDNPLETERLLAWDMAGEMKVVLRGESVTHLRQLCDEAKRQLLPTFLVEDAGRTQIPAGSVTVLSIFGPKERVDKVTGSLKLL